VRATLKPVRGRNEWPEEPAMTLVVRPSEITDPEGKVIEVIG
jgi:suppressor of fused